MVEGIHLFWFNYYIYILYYSLNSKLLVVLVFLHTFFIVYLDINIYLNA
jgi:hypothetical protein